MNDQKYKNKTYGKRETEDSAAHKPVVPWATNLESEMKVEETAIAIRLVEVLQFQLWLWACLPTGKEDSLRSPTMRLSNKGQRNFRVVGVETLSNSQQRQYNCSIGNEYSSGTLILLISNQRNRENLIQAPNAWRAKHLILGCMVQEDVGNFAVTSSYYPSTLMTTNPRSHIRSCPFQNSYFTCEDTLLRTY